MQASNKVSNNTAQDIYPFENHSQCKLFNKIIHELRCSVCQNQTLSDSMAPLALDLRLEIYQKIQSEYSEQQIIEFVTKRYGDFVLYQPPLKLSTSLLWFGPFIILLLGFTIFFKYVKRTS